MPQFPKPFPSWGSVCSPRRFHCVTLSRKTSRYCWLEPCGWERLTLGTPNQCPPLVWLVWHLQPVWDANSPSAPVCSTIFFTFSANNFLLLWVAAAVEKLAVSPHPPIATMIAVPSANLERTEETVSNKGHDGGSTWLNMETGMKARAT